VIRSIFRGLERLIKYINRRLNYSYYKMRLAYIGKNVFITIGVRIFEPQNISIGDNVHINEGVIIQSCEGATIKIGNDVIISYRAMILTGGMKKDPRGDWYNGHYGRDIVIEDNVWICAGAILLPGVTIKKGTTIGPGAVVSGIVPEKTYVKGTVPRIFKL